MKRLLIVLVCLGGASIASAQTPEVEKKAEEYFVKGDTAYNLGRYDEAVTWFEKAYETWPQAEFLYNIAQSYRLAGNCKKALHFYKRFRSLKEKDTENPLSQKKKDDIDRFIKDLESCAAKADDSAGQQPDTVERPGGGGDTTTTGGGDTTTTTTGGDDTTTTTTGGDTTTTTTGGDDVAAAGGGGDDDDDDDDLIEEDVTVGAPKLLSARLGMGMAIFSAGDLEVPVQPSFGITAGYPLAAGPVILDLGANFTYSPLPYKVMDMQEQATLLGIRADVGVTYPVNPKIGVRGDLGLGLAKLSGLVQGNPFTDDFSPASFSMFSFRLGVSADYAFTPNVVATVTPFSLAFSPAPEEAFMDSLVEINLLVGVGYRM
jgi:hypothetical protein